MQTSYTASVLLLRVLVHAAVARGARRDEILAALDIPPHLLDEPEARVPHDVIRVAWDEIPRRLDDNAFGVHVGGAAGSGAFDIVDYVTSHSADLGSAYRKLIRYQRIVHDAAGLRFEIRGSIARLTHQIPAGVVVSRHASEFFMAAPLAFGRRLTGTSFTPIEVTFTHPAPADTAEHRRFFGAGVSFGRPITSMTLDAAIMARPLLGADPALGRVLERYAEQIVAAQPAREESFSDRVSRLVRQEIRAEAPQAASIARRLGVSERTLLRRLREQGLTYQGLVDAVRKEMALRRLRAEDASPTEVAFFLGFSDVSAFYRAFRRWTGQTPVEFRRSVVAGVAARDNGLALGAKAAAVEGG